MDALFRQSGVIRTDTLEEMFDVATLLANQPVPEGRSVAIVTNAGGLGILCADTCEAHGLAVPELAPRRPWPSSRSFLPAARRCANPVDMIASATGEDYGRAIRVVAADPGDRRVDRDLHPAARGSTRPRSRARWSTRSASSSGRIPVLTCFMSARGLPEALRAPGVRDPVVRVSRNRPRSRSRTPSSTASGAAKPRRTCPRSTGIRAGRGGRGDRRRARARRGVAPAGRGRSSCSSATACRSLARSASRHAGGGRARPLAFDGRVALKAVGPLHKTEVGRRALGLCRRRGRRRRRAR